MNRPNFFIIGAPKCGTTSLARWLSSHPQVFMCPVKEPHYFSTDFNRGEIGSLEEYEALFEGAAPEHLAIGEASTEYLYSDNAVPGIENLYKGSRYIVMVRNPVDLAFSLYNYEKQGGRERILTFKEAWDQSPARRSGRHTDSWCSDPKWLDYQRVALLGQQFERLLDRVERSRVLVLVLGDVKRDPRAEYLKVVEFLSLDDDGRTAFPPENVAKKRRWRSLTRAIQTAGAASRDIKKRLGLPVFKGTGLLRLIDSINSDNSLAPKMDPEVRREVSAYFQKDVRLLSELIGRDVSVSEATVYKPEFGDGR